MNDFKYGNCPICNKPMTQMRRLFISCPANQLEFSKKSLRSKEVKIQGVSDPNPELWICKEHGTFGSMLNEMESF
jgi:hypothetical protein